MKTPCLPKWNPQTQETDLNLTKPPHGTHTHIQYASLFLLFITEVLKFNDVTWFGFVVLSLYKSWSGLTLIKWMEQKMGFAVARVAIFNFNSSAVLHFLYSIVLQFKIAKWLMWWRWRLHLNVQFKCKQLCKITK